MDLLIMTSVIAYIVLKVRRRKEKRGEKYRNGFFR
jgi:hypothetical protein